MTPVLHLRNLRNLRLKTSALSSLRLGVSAVQALLLRCRAHEPRLRWLAMRIQFCGADRTVTGSCHLIEVNGLRLFLDFGMYQGPRDEARQINQHLPDRATKVDAVILSHGHFDHCGKLPMLTKAGYTGPIYCTAATAAVARVVLEDAGEIQEEDAQYLNRRSRDTNEQPIEPLFRRVDVRDVLRGFRTIKYGQKTDLGRGVSFTFHDAGHILGSAYVVVEWTEAGKPHN